MPQQIARMFDLDPNSPHLLCALTHSSFANEQGDAEDNQRLEFLGDSVLGLCVSELLWQRFPEADEGQLSRMRSQLVSTEALGQWGREHGIAVALRVGRGAESSGLRENISVIADTVEAIIAAVFLEGGLDLARKACSTVVSVQLERLVQGIPGDPKTVLQERAQAKARVMPSYALIETWGPAHEKWFKVRVSVAGVDLAEGTGRSKRAAERAAAQGALSKLTHEHTAQDAAAQSDGESHE